MNRGYSPVPVSINVSRIDIFSMDVPKYLLSLIEQYEISPDLLKVEITESAYAEDGAYIIETVNRLRENGFIVMMDDFGSGYSSLNMLKSVPVDVLKMDMRFLEINENEEEKGVGILESVVNMSRQMRIPIVVEGVETQVQENLLRKMGCCYTQGYLYYKPMPIDAFEKLLVDDNALDHAGFRYRQAESVHLREFLDTNLFNDTVINNILGPAVFYDVYENNVEITRVNEQYFKLAGIPRQEEEDYRKRFWNSVRDDDKQLLVSIFAQAYHNVATGASGFINLVRRDGVTLWINIKAFFLREKDGHKLFYASLLDIGGEYYIAAIKLDDTATDNRAYFKDISIKKTVSVRGTNTRFQS
jgi:PAS domain-containing protein